MALALVMTIPLIRYLHLQEKNRLIKLGLSIGMVLTALAAVGSQSRGALVALTVTGTIFWFKSRNKFASAFLIGLAVFLALLVMPEAWYARMSTIQTYEQDASALGRINSWWMAWNLANDRLFGGGFETWHRLAFSLYAPDPGNFRDVHSIFFEVLGEHGWPGFVLYVTLLVMTWRKCSATIRLAKNRPDALWARDLGTMLQVSLVGYVSAGTFLGLAYFDFYYHLVAIAVVVHALVKDSSPASVVSSDSGAQVPAIDSRLRKFSLP